MVDAVVRVFLGKLIDALQEESRIVVEFKDQFEKLKSELQLMQSFLKDADRLKRKNQIFRTIMMSTTTKCLDGDLQSKIIPKWSDWKETLRR
ncbi:hypothetical protein HHK36_010525 [Tetracentron sinense]|uniref:Disease resistance N-terminal domain-containing protein n=1 Tax=Tetracentron sinense TaxID=13715 RepID=A0A835DIL9_TETSI|nr:hypothetical protein HHK36_010525 [Tetracentron sinense]